MRATTRHAFLVALLLTLGLPALCFAGRLTTTPELDSLSEAPLGDEAELSGAALAEWLAGDRSAAEELALTTSFAAATSLTTAGGEDPLGRLGELDAALQLKADSAHAKIERLREKIPLGDNLAVGELDIDNLAAALPLGWRQYIGDEDDDGQRIEAALAITEGRLKATHAEVDLVLELKFPDSEEQPIFFADGIPWSREGGFQGEVTLELLGDWGIDIAKADDGSSRARLVLKAGSGTPESRARGDGTYVTVDCNRVVAAGLSAELHLAREWVIPVIGGEVKDGPNDRQRVMTTLDFNLDKNGLFASTTFAQPFVFPKKRDVQFSVGEVTVDFSSAVNSPSMRVPEGYKSPHRSGKDRMAATWEGIFIQGVKIQLDKDLQSDTREFAGGAETIIIDETGFTADISVENILPLGEKSIGNWAFSVDKVGLRIVHSTFEAASIDGLVEVPLLTKKSNSCEKSDYDGPPRREDCLGYGGMIGNEGFAFTLTLNDDYCIPAWQADAVTLDKGSQIKLGKDKDGLYAGAMLHGGLSINQRNKNGKATIDVEGVTFETLVMSSRKPYFSPGNWRFPKFEAELAGFKVTFSDIRVQSAEDLQKQKLESRLSFRCSVAADTGMNFDATGGLALLAEADLGSKNMRWKYKRLLVESFEINASTPAFSFEGKLGLYGQEEEDPVWGKGFYGSIKLKLTVLKGGEEGQAGFGAVAQFGSKTVGGSTAAAPPDTRTEKQKYKDRRRGVDRGRQTEGTGVGEVRRYFLIDVMAYVGPLHIPVLPGLELFAVGGGAYKNMNPSSAFLDLSEGGDGSLASVEGERPLDVFADGSNPPFLGTTLTGKRYEVIPDGRYGFYLQLILVSAGKDAVTIGGTLEFTIVPKESFTASITASVEFMREPDPKSKLASGGIVAYAEIELIKDRQGVRFKATSAAYVDIRDQIQGTAIERSTVRQDYVRATGYAGKLSIYISKDDWWFFVGKPNTPISVSARGLNLSAYVCIGTQVPPMPAIPNNIREVVGPIPRGASETDLANGSGFAFGAGLGYVRERTKITGKFHYELWINGGFDVNIRDYGNMTCRHAKGGGAPGFDGWYAAGQAYAGFSIQIYKWKRNRKKGLQEITAAAALKLKGPNPIYAYGVIAGKIRIFKIKVKFKAKAEIGEQC